MDDDILHRPTLVLNRSWRAVHVTTVGRALVMLWAETVQVIDPETFLAHSWEEWLGLEPPSGRPCVRTARLRLRAPEVVCLSDYDRMPLASVPFSRRNVAKRDHYTCQYCGAQPGMGSITIDHVVPRSQGGTSSWSNCVSACVSCNARKGNRTPEQAGMSLRRHPTRPDWRPLYNGRGTGPSSWSKFLGVADLALAVTS